MSRRHFPLLRFFLLSLCVLCIGRHSADANMADPSRPGDPVGEPSPLLDSIHVLSEQLTIDLRPAAHRDPGVVQATYRLRNDGAAKSLDLMFIAGGLDSTYADDFIVRINGVRIPARFSDSVPLPARWKLPAHTPGLGDRDSLPYDVMLRDPRGLSSKENARSIEQAPGQRGQGVVSSVLLFALPLGQGEHTVTVTYKARLTGYPYESAVYTWQLGYVLSPARRWGSFGRLDARILLPEEWEAATWPEMRRSGDTLYGVWNGLPADAIAVSTRFPIPTVLYTLARVSPILLVLILAALLTFRMGWKKGQRLAAEGRRDRKALFSVVPVALLSTLLTFLMLGAGSIAGAVWEKSLLGGQGIPDYGLGVGLLIFIFFVSPPFWIALFIPSPIPIIGAVVGRRRALRDDPPLQIGIPEPKEGI